MPSCGDSNTRFAYFKTQSKSAVLTEIFFSLETQPKFPAAALPDFLSHTPGNTLYLRSCKREEMGTALLMGCGFGKATWHKGQLFLISGAST